MIEKHWKLKENYSDEQVKSLFEQLGISRPFISLLLHLGIQTFEEARDFFRPTLSKLYDPFLMDTMIEAVERIEKAFKNHENILIYGDYDVDGTTSVTLLMDYFQYLSNELNYKGKIAYYIPDRHTEGYGLSFKGVEYAANNGFTLVITVDCGIKAVDKVEKGNLLGLDFIICDHHLPGDILPNAIAVLDPQKHNCKYPYKFLSGCGVAFKLAQALQSKFKLPEDKIFDYLDLTVVSIASDIVPITGENRILAFYGLKKINESPRQGLQSIIKIAGIEDKIISIETIVFKIGPRINAAGRIETGRTAVDLLLSGDMELANQISTDLNELNTSRKNLDKITTEEALMQIEAQGDINKKATVVYNENWHKGVIGIVASRLIEKYYRPTIVITKSNGSLTGSGRTVDGFDLYGAIDHCAPFLERYGGHFHAAGINLKPENFEKFKDAFINFVNANIRDEQLVPSLEIDLELDFKSITPKFYNILKQFEPHGPDNMTPVFITRNLTHNNTARLMGKTQEHLRMEVYNDAGFHFTAVGFYMDKIAKKIMESNCFDLCYSLDLNEYNGRSTIQLMIKDIKSYSE